MVLDLEVAVLHLLTPIMLRKHQSLSSGSTTRLNPSSDKKSAVVNWIEGRGKSVVCEAIIKEEVVKKVLKTTVPALVELNMIKNLAESIAAGALGVSMLMPATLSPPSSLLLGKILHKMRRALTANGGIC